MIDLSLEQAWANPTLAIVNSTAVYMKVTFPKVYVISMEGLTKHTAYIYIAYSMVNRVESEEERQERLARRRKHY